MYIASLLKSQQFSGDAYARFSRVSQILYLNERDHKIYSLGYETITILYKYWC